MLILLFSRFVVWVVEVDVEAEVEAEVEVEVGVEEEATVEDERAWKDDEMQYSFLFLLGKLWPEDSYTWMMGMESFPIELYVWTHVYGYQ